MCVRGFIWPGSDFADMAGEEVGVVVHEVSRIFSDPDLGLARQVQHLVAYD